ncbi:MAG: DUF6446 family protein [Gemmobacter sp.]
MRGKAIALLIVLTSLIGGAALYYVQVYAFYTTLPPEAAADLRVTLSGGTEVPVVARDFQGIDAASSPIRYRACLVPQGLPPVADLAPYPAAEPLNGPGWFACYDAGTIAAALADGTARAVLGQRDVHFGIDRVIALMADGRAYAWHQINPCGRAVFDGKPAPEGCPPPPASFGN